MNKPPLMYKHERLPSRSVKIVQDCQSFLGAFEAFPKCMELAVRGEEQQMEQDHPLAASSVPHTTLQGQVWCCDKAQSLQSSEMHH